MKLPAKTAIWESLLNLAGKVIDRMDPPRMPKPITARHDAKPITPEELSETQPIVKTKRK